MNSNSIKASEEESKQKITENSMSSTTIKNKKKIKENLDLDIQKPKINNKKSISLSPRYNSHNDIQKKQIFSEDNNNINGKNNSNESKESEDSQSIKKEDSINYDSNKNVKKRKIKFPNFISMNTLKLCQCCNKVFNKEKNIPFLLKCNHIFCKKCLENYFTDEEGIKCPIDDLVGKSLSDIKILYNFLDSKNSTSNSTNNNINNIKQPKNNIKRNNNIHSYNDNKKLRKSDQTLKRKTKKKILNLKNNFMMNTYDKIKNTINVNEHLKHNDSSKIKKNRTNPLLQKNHSITNIMSRPYNKSSSYFGNIYENINLGKINNNIIHSKSNLNEFFNLELDGVQNSEYEDVNIDEDLNNYCNIHPAQKITHYVEETKELICIHCAFNKLKNNPNIIIKEIPEKSKEFLNDLDIIIGNNQKYAQIIQNSINDINNNKENEEKKIIEIYEQLLNSLVANRNNFLVRIEGIYQENINSMNKKLDNFEEIINTAEKLKEDFRIIYDKAPYEFNQLIQAFNNFLREINDNSCSDLNIIQYNFSHDELDKVLKYLNDFADVKTRKKTFKFDLLKNSKNNNISIKDIKNYINFHNTKNLFRNSISNYYKNDKKINKLNKKYFFSINSFNNNNTINDMNYRNSLSNLNIKNNSFLYRSNNDNMRIKIKYEDENDINKYSRILKNNIYKKYIDSNNNNTFNNNNYKKNTLRASRSESINDTLNKYIASTSMIRDNLYNQAPLITLKNSGNNSSNSSIRKNKKLNKFDGLEILNKYKIPVKIITK